MKNNWAIVKYNFSLYKFYYFIFTVILGFYIIILLITPAAYDDKTRLLSNNNLNRMIFSLFWTITFFDYLALANKVFHKNIKNKQEQIMLFSKITRQGLFLSNLFFLLIYAFTRMLLLFIIVAICYGFKPKFSITNVLWLLFNITINCLFVIMLFVFICLRTFSTFDKQFLWFGILGAIFLYMTMIITLFQDKVGMIFSYIPIFGITAPEWITNNAWQQYLNLPISILGSAVFIFINIRLNQKIEY